MQPLGIYIHYPFCLALCPYCDFNSFVKDDTSEDAIVDKYLIELADYKTKILQNKQVASIYFGGGTPSLMNPKSVQKIIDFIANNFVIAKNIEITLEANPTSVENKKLQDFKQAGINRVSVGIQALNDADLQFLGRKHSATEAIKAIELAGSIFDEFSFDLIYARHNNHKLDDWKNELKQAISMAGNHLSLYSLTIEKGTDFFAQNIKGTLPIAKPEQSEEMYFETIDIMQQNGFERYEISNFAKNNKKSKHNMLYWQVHDYLGVGPGAHGRIFYKNGERIQTMTQHKTQKWLDCDELQIEQKISQNEQICEILMMGLRIIDGIDIVDIKNRLNIDLFKNINMDLLQKYQSMGLIEFDETKIIPTNTGINLTNSLAKKLIIKIN